MSWKTLMEKFGDMEELTTSPFDFQKEMTIIAMPAEEVGPAVEEPKASAGTVLNMPAIPHTKTVEVIEEPETFKGELPHLTPDEHAAIIDWVDKQSMEASVPLEVRAYLTDLALKLQLDAKKRIVPTETGVEGSAE